MHLSLPQKVFDPEHAAQLSREEDKTAYEAYLRKFGNFETRSLTVRIYFLDERSNPVRGAPPQRTGAQLARGEGEGSTQEGKIGQMYLYSRNFIGAFYGVSEIFLTPRKRTV